MSYKPLNLLLLLLFIQGCSTVTDEIKNEQTSKKVDEESNKILFLDSEYTIIIPENYNKIGDLSNTSVDIYSNPKDSSNFQVSIGDNSNTFEFLQEQGIENVTLDTIVELHTLMHFSQIKSKLIDTVISKITIVENSQFPSRRFIITGRLPNSKTTQTYLCENITTATKSIYLLFYCPSESFKKREPEYFKIINSLNSNYKRN